MVFVLHVLHGIYTSNLSKINFLHHFVQIISNYNNFFQFFVHVYLQKPYGIALLYFFKNIMD